MCPTEQPTIEICGFRLLKFLDVFSGKIQVEEDTSVSFVNENMNTSLVDLTVNHWDDLHDQQWFTINISKLSTINDVSDRFLLF